MSKKSKIPEQPEGSTYAGEMRPIADLYQHKNNPRILKDRKFRDLVRSVKDAPWMLYENRIKYVDDGLILCGNQRYLVCKAAGFTHVPCDDVSYLTQAQRDELMLKDNSHAGEWDTEMLSSFFDHDTLDSWGLNFGVVEFDMTESGPQNEAPSADLQGNAFPGGSGEGEDEPTASKPSDPNLFPLGIVVNKVQQLQWARIKDQLGSKRDSEAFTRLLGILKNHDITKLTVQ